MAFLNFLGRRQNAKPNLKTRGIDWGYLSGCPSFAEYFSELVVIKTPVPFCRWL